jgi:hypothetical protein
VPVSILERYVGFTNSSINSSRFENKKGVRLNPFFVPAPYFVN